MTERLSTIEMNPEKSPVGSIIWLHGLGADGNDFVPLVPELKLPLHLPLRFIFPNAPLIPVTINSGYVMPAWYDILSLSVEHHADQKGIEASIQKLYGLIQQEEKKGIPVEKIILAGFSQGAVIALTTGLTYPNRLGGIIALSGYLPEGNQVMQNASATNKTLPIFLGHGTEDTVVRYELGKNTLSLLQKNHYSVDWHSYRMAHSVSAEEVSDIAKFIKRIYE